MSHHKLIRVKKVAFNNATITTIVKKAAPWRSGEDSGLVFQGSVVRAPAQEIFHFNSGLLSFNKPEKVLWTIAKYYYYYKTISLLASFLKNNKHFKFSFPSF